MFDKNGNWSSDFYPEQDRDNEVPITASKFQTLIQENLKQSFQNCITRDGAGKTSVDFDLNSHKLVNVADGSIKTDAPNIGQVQRNLFLFADDTSIDANKITITLSPSFNQYLAGQQFYFKLANDSTTSEVSFNSNGVGLCRVRMNGSDDIPYGALKKGVVYHGVYTVDNTLTSEATYSGRRLQILSETVNEEKVLSHKEITNCILSAPNGLATQNSLTITLPNETRVLLYAGKNANGTINNTQYITSSESYYNFIGTESDGYYFVFVGEDGLSISTENTLQTGKCLIAEVLISSGRIVFFKPAEVLEVAKKQDLPIDDTPDYSSRYDVLSLIDNKEKKVVADGYLWVAGWGGSQSDGNNSIWINGVEYKYNQWWYVGNYRHAFSSTALVRVQPNDVVKMTNQGNITASLWAYFIPLKSNSEQVEKLVDILI